MICQWCGDEHPIEALCQRAQRGMTRRSFIFLTSAALVAQALPTLPSSELVQMVYLPPHLNMNLGQILAEEWNRIIEQRILDNVFHDAPIKKQLAAAIKARVKEGK